MAAGSGRITGSVAIVTGAGTEGEGVGIGKAISLRFAREGAAICVLDRVGERAKETLKEIEADDGTGFVVEADVSISDDCARAVTETVHRFGKLDILINSAAIGSTDYSVEMWEKVLAVNLKGPMLMSTYAAPHMAKAGGGSIVNISSIAAFVDGGAPPAYPASKAGLHALTRNMALRYGVDGIRVNAIAPGGIQSPMAARFGRSLSPEVQQKIIPVGHGGTPWDIAAAALFFASDDAVYVSGVCMPVDGGLTAISSQIVYRRLGSD